MLPENWESCIVHLINVREDELLDPRRNYWGHFVTVNGWGVEPPFAEVRIRTVSFFIRRGGHLLYNGYVDGKECVITPPSSFHGSVTVFNQKHFSGQKEQ